MVSQESGLSSKEESRVRVVVLHEKHEPCLTIRCKTDLIGDTLHFLYCTI